MNKALVLILALPMVGCFAAQRDAINEEANYRLQTLDRQCRTNMTEWCRTQYEIVERNRSQELSDLEARRHHTAEILSHVGDGFQQQQNTVHCTTSYVGSYAYTNCH